MHVEMAGDDSLSALGLDSHSVLTSNMNAGVIYPEIDASGAVENNDYRRSCLLGCRERGLG